MFELTNLYYSIYLVVVFLSVLLINYVGGLKIDFRKAMFALLPVILVFVAWDILATELGHWEFGIDKMLGIVIINQPIEELAFFIAVPLFYIAVWESAKKYLS